MTNVETQISQEELGMEPKLVCFVPQILERKGWTASVLAGHFGVNGASPNNGYRMARGETGYLDETLRLAAKILGVSSISEIEDIVWVDEEASDGAGA